ncbi:Disease resistance protein [Camellia lanceoleosa]|uniref:Disease resistance protein n=1 Tax=Camellia lanceoleosa TaxID=1840588 RepID=A0ACC0G8R4_9ERIC|nr:Disease resistance protein [Camellia lanceoleosa]
MAPVGRHFGYLFSYKSEVKNLKEEVEKLDEKRGAMQLSVDEAERNVKVIGPDVKGWLERVDKCSDEAREILKDEVEANKGCLYGWCPNLKLRYSLGKKATNKAKEVAKLHEERKLTEVAYNEPPPGIESTSTEGIKVFESRRLITNDVMEALKDDRFHMIAICGMGGVGKTTMVKEVAKRANKEKLFDEVVMAVVSQIPDKRKIQGEIGDKLGLKFEEETERGRADRLCERLKGTKRILVILDDVWKRLELNDIGIPFRDVHSGCKILLTSRFDNVCNSMNAQKKFTVEVLTKEEAWNLFEEMAGISKDTSHTRTDLYSTQKKVADECGCLPIAIVTVARALKDKDEHSWNSALLQLRKSMVKNFSEVEENVFRSLELSYDFLGGREIKECFLLCSLYAEDFNIPIEDIVRFGVGMELFENIDSVAEARDRVHAFVDDLKKGYLLMDGELESCVKIHDVVRDVAISIASREEHSFMVRCDEALKEWPEKERHKNYAVISLRFTGMSKLPDNLEFPKLHILRLEDNYASNLPNLPDGFYGGMKELKALSMLNVYIEGSLPTSLRWLTNLRSLSLYKCELINDVSVIGALENLEILSFEGTKIEKLPKEIGRLSHLKLLDLLQCGVKRICPGVLSSLSKLEELYLGASFHDESRIEETKATLTELCGLSNFTTLVIHLQGIAYWPRDLVLANLKAFAITISNYGTLPIYPFNYQLQNELCLGDGHESDFMESEFKNLLKITEILYITAAGVKNVGYDLDKDGFKKLTNLYLDDCPDLEYVIDTTDGVPVPQMAFPVLQFLYLENLDKLKKICHGQLPEGAFSALKELELEDLPALTHLWKGPTQLVRLCNLTSLELERCHKLESMFSLSIARDLMQLQTLSVTECRKMEVLISSEEGDQNEIASTTTDKIVFPKLKDLFLASLPSFTDICKAINGLELLQLNELILCEIPKLKSFCNTSDSSYDTIQPLFNKVELITLERLSIVGMDNVIEIWPRELQPKVREMIIMRCRKLSNILFPSKVIKGMQSLEQLNVGYCQSVEVAFDLEGIIVGEGYPDIVLPSLTKLVLVYLPKLTHVWKNNLLRIPSFQNLTSLTVVGCSSLRYIFSSSQAKLLVKLREIAVAECGVLEAIVNEEPKVDDEVATNIIMFPQLSSLKLYHLPSLKSLCPQAYTFEGSFIEKIKVINCPNMRALPSALQRMLELQESNVREVEFFNSAQHHLLDRKFSLSTNGILDVTGIDEPSEIWHNQLEVGCLDGVRFMRVQCCGKLSSVVSSKLMQRLHNIQGLKIWLCDSLEIIFDLQEGVCADVAEKETLITKLSKLKLKYLPKLTHIWKNISQQTHCFKVLRFLTVEHCDNLRYIFTISMANVLVNLEGLTVEHCEKVEKIVTRENEEEIFSRKIKYVHLANLPSLVCFGPDVNDTEIPASMTKAFFCRKFPGHEDEIDFEEELEIDFDKLVKDKDEDEDEDEDEDDF